MADGDDLAVVSAEYDIGASQTVYALVAAKRAHQAGHRLVGHQVADTTAAIVVVFTESRDDRNLIFTEAPLLGALAGMDRHLGLATGSGLVAGVRLVQIVLPSTWNE